MEMAMRNGVWLPEPSVAGMVPGLPEPVQFAEAYTEGLKPAPG